MTPIRPRPWLRTALWLSAVLILAWLWLGQRGSVRIRPAAAAPHSAGLEVVDLAGAPVDLDGLRGNVVVLNLWASWCGPCRMEIPSLASLHRDHGERGLVVIGVNVDEGSPEEIRGLGESLGITYRIVRPSGRLREPFRTDGVIPHTWILDREGRVRVSHRGYASRRSLRRACARLLDEGTP